MRNIAALGIVLLAGGLAGCVAPQPPPPTPLVAVPGPAKTEAAFQQDDAACRAGTASLSNAPAQPTAEQLAAAQSATAQVDAVPPPAEALPPGVAYLRCMTARQNLVQPLAPAVPLYAYYPAYPIYAGIGFGYPFFYDDLFAVRFGFGYGGFGYRGYGYRGYGGYRNYGGYGGGFRGTGGFGGRGGGRR